MGRSCQPSPSAQRDVVGVRPGAFLVHEPVVDHELDPRRGDHVEDRGGLEGGAGQELEADLPRAGRHEVGGVRERFAQRHVAPEPHAGTAHPGTFEVVVRAVARAHVVGVTSWRRRGALERRLLGVVKILLPQLVANLVQLDALSRTGKVEPVVGNFAHDELPEQTVDCARQKEGHASAAVVPVSTSFLGQLVHGRATRERPVTARV